MFFQIFIHIMCVYYVYKGIIMAKIRTNITLDPKLKKDACKIFDDLGLDLSTGISLFLKQVVVHKGLPFDVNSSKDNIFYKYQQLKYFVEFYCGIKNKKYVNIKDCFSKQEIEEGLKEFEDFKKNPKKYKIYKNFEEGLKDLDIEI